MKALLVAAAFLSIAVLLPAPASAQQQGALTLWLGTPEPLTQDRTVTFTGYATLTVDLTGALATSGIPVTYSIIEQPAWANAIISPSSDVFPAPVTPPAGASYTMTRAFTVTVAVGDGPGVDATEVLQLAAVTSPGPFGQHVTGQGATIVTFLAPEEPCPEHAFTDAQIREMTSTAVEAYNEHESAEDADGSDDVTVQSANASPVPIASIAVAGFGIVGAGVGLLLRRRLL